MCKRLTCDIPWAGLGRAFARRKADLVQSQGAIEQVKCVHAPVGYAKEHGVHCAHITTMHIAPQAVVDVVQAMVVHCHRV